MWIQICNCLSTIPGLCDRTQLTLVDKTPRTHIRECLFVHALRLLVSLLFFILFSRSKIYITNSVRITTFTITDLTEILSAVYCAIQHPLIVNIRVNASRTNDSSSTNKILVPVVLAAGSLFCRAGNSGPELMAGKYRLRVVPFLFAVSNHTAPPDCCIDPMIIDSPRPDPLPGALVV